MGIEEKKSFVEGDSVIVWRRRWRVAVGQGFGNDDGKCNHKESNNKRPNGILEHLAAANYATQVYIFLLILVALMIWTQQPTLLCLIQMTMLLLPFHVSTPLIFSAS